MNFIWIDRERSTAWVAGDEAKAGEDIHVSVNELAMEVLLAELAEMVRRYAHWAPAQLAKHAAVIVALMYDTNTAQWGFQGDSGDTKKPASKALPDQSSPNIF